MLSHKFVGTEGSTDKTDIMSSISSWKDKRSGRGTSSAEGEEENHDKKRASTGIPDLDLLIEGGFPVGKSYLVTGEQGSGKTLFCIQFILNGLLGGEKAVYVTVNEKPADIIAEANSLGWSLLKFVEEKKLLILDASPLLSASTNRVSKSGGPDVAKTISDLASYVKKMEASRVVIDPVDPLIGSADSSSATQEHTRTLVHALQDQIETTNLLTSNSLNLLRSASGISAAGVSDMMGVSGVGSASGMIGFSTIPLSLTMSNEYSMRSMAVSRILLTKRVRVKPFSFRLNPRTTTPLTGIPCPPAAPMLLPLKELEVSRLVVSI